MKKSKFSWKSMSVLLGILVVLVAALAPHYVWTLERARAGAAEASVINAAVAENLYFINHKTYTNDWSLLAQYIPAVDASQGVFAPLGKPGEERFFAFNEQGLAAGKAGFYFGIRLNEDNTSGTVYARRTGGLFEYSVQEGFPKPGFACQADGFAGKWFCRKFAEYLKPFLMQQAASDPQLPAQPVVQQQPSASAAGAESVK